MWMMMTAMKMTIQKMKSGTIRERKRVMTVQELQNKLNCFDGDMEVVIAPEDLYPLLADDAIKVQFDDKNYVGIIGVDCAL